MLLRDAAAAYLLLLLLLLRATMLVEQSVLSAKRLIDRAGANRSVRRSAGRCSGAPEWSPNLAIVRTIRMVLVAQRRRLSLSNVVSIIQVFGLHNVYIH